MNTPTLPTEIAGKFRKTEIGDRQVQCAMVQHLQDEGLPVCRSDKNLHQDLAVWEQCSQ